MATIYRKLGAGLTVRIDFEESTNTITRFEFIANPMPEVSLILNQEQAGTLAEELNRILETANQGALYFG